MQQIGVKNWTPLHNIFLYYSHAAKLEMRTHYAMGMHISNFAAQLRLASEEFMQNDTIYDPLSHDDMVLPPIGINFFEVVHGCQSA